MFKIMENELVPIQKMIFEIRGQKVMLDSDLARLYGVELKVMNQAVKRNIERFPSDFMFQLTEDEWNILRSQFVTSRDTHGGRRYAPYVFTEHGILMLSSVLNSDKAIEVNIKIMRTFIHLRQFVISQSDTNDQLTELRKILMLHIDNCDYKFAEHDKAIGQILQVLNNLLEKPKQTGRIGF